MKIKKFLITLGFAGIAMFIGCGENQPQVKKTQDLAPWLSWSDNIVSKYNQSGGFADWACESTDDMTDNFSMTIAENKARQKLAKDLEIKVKGSIKNYQDKTKAKKATREGSVNEEAMIQTIDQNLKGAYPVAHKIFKAPKGYQMCAVVALDPNKVKNIIKEIAGKAGIEDDKFLYEEFKAQKAFKQLNQ
jgi:hypothetical protein